MRRAYAGAAILLLAVAAFTAQVLTLSATRRQPRYDEVSYISVARDYHRMGGALAVIGCHFAGKCHEDNRNPIFELVLEPFAHDDPSFFADAKLITLATGLFLLLVSFVIARRAFSTRVAIVTVVLLCLMPTLGEIASGVLADLLFAAIMLACVYAIGACQARGPVAWLGTGALVGIAYLAKGNGHLVLLALLTTGLATRGRRLFARPEPYLAIVGFVVTASFLLWRNLIVYRAPFHNFNDRPIWLDGWDDVWRMLRDPEWQRVGLGWYLHRHSVLALAWRIVKDLGQAVGVSLYTLGLGVTGGTPATLRTSVADGVVRVATGAAVVALAVRGLVDRHRAGQRAEVWAALSVSAWVLLAFGVGAQGVGGVATRFMLPLAVLYVPYAAHALVNRVAPWCRARLSRWPRVPQGRVPLLLAGLAGLALALKLAWFSPALAVNPRAQFDVPGDWAEASDWLSRHLRPGERFAISYRSLYSTWDRPLPDPDARWPYLYRVGAAEMLRVLDEAKPLSVSPRWDGPPIPITKILVDATDPVIESFRDKLSAASDGHGPLAFLGWPRCFADTGIPSRFLIYCR